MENISELQEEVLIGSLLGDGHLEKLKNGKNACLRIQRALNDQEYLNWEAAVFKDYLTPKGVSFGQHKDKRTDKIYKNVRLRTKCNELFTLFHGKWYLNKKKIVPRDLKLTEKIVSVWLADDGHFIPGKCRKPKEKTYKKEYPYRIDIKIATHGFSVEESEFLSELLSKTFDIKTSTHWANKEKTQKTIHVHGKHAIKLIRRIDSVFPPLDRKSILWRRPEAKLWENDKIYTCKYCNSEKVYKNGTNNGVQKYHCQSCGKQFYKPKIIKEEIL